MPAGRVRRPAAFVNRTGGTADLPNYSATELCDSIEADPDARGHVVAADTATHRADALASSALTHLVSRIAILTHLMHNSARGDPIRSE